MYPTHGVHAIHLPEHHLPSPWKCSKYHLFDGVLSVNWFRGTAGTSVSSTDQRRVDTPCSWRIHPAGSGAEEEAIRTTWKMRCCIRLSRYSYVGDVGAVMGRLVGWRGDVTHPGLDPGPALTLPKIAYPWFAPQLEPAPRILGALQLGLLPVCREHSMCSWTCHLYDARS